MFPVNQNNIIEENEEIKFDLIDTDIEIPFNYLTYILNSTSYITPEILFDGFKVVLPFYQDVQLKPLFELAFDQDVNINSQNKDNGCTFLHYSVEDVKVLYDNIPQFLLEKGADPNIQNKDGNTPLHILINRDFFSSKEIYVAKLLIQYGADIELKNLLGWTPIQCFIQAGNIKLKALLQLVKACKDNDFSKLDITTKDIKEFLDWQISITPENSKFF
ncbi:ankyrin repeat family protein [Rickettsia felis str. Pedreira]|nr:ankyrin repeat domain-containing protein [Rickettsia felis]KJV58372.1 ankyrin repeat family protein [Rickettsia felis str. Pedreira]MDE8612054.1 ankyrin repeat domain-containing protein [Rickettsia felis]